MSVSVEELLFVPHSWRSPLEFSLEWRTNVLPMIGKGEKRSSLFTWPRRGLKLDIWPASIEEFNYLKRYLYKSLYRVWGVPFWEDQTRLSLQASIGQLVLEVESTQFRNFEVGGLCAVISSWFSYEVKEIESLTATEITLTENLSFTWSAKTEVFPILKARLEGAVSYSLPVPQIGGLSLDFSEVWDEGITRSLGDASAFPVYKTHPVLNLDPDWNNLVKHLVLYPYELMQFLGKDFVFSTREYSDVGVGGRWSIYHRESIWNFRGFFNEMKGRWGTFWMPSHSYDVMVTAAFGAADVTLTIQDIEFSVYWGSEPVYLLFHFQDGEEVHRKVLSSPTSTTIVLEEAIGKSCSVEELARLRVSFLYLSRLDGDRIVFKYPVQEVIEVGLVGMRVEE